MQSTSTQTHYNTEVVLLASAVNIHFYKRLTSSFFSFFMSNACSFSDQSPGHDLEIQWLYTVQGTFKHPQVFDLDPYYSKTFHLYSRHSVPETYNIYFQYEELLSEQKRLASLYTFVSPTSENFVSHPLAALSLNN